MIKYLSGVLITFLIFGQISAGEIIGTVKCKGVKTNSNVVVYIEKMVGEYPPPTIAEVMNQENLRFQPHVLPVTVGTTVDFLNSDDVLHNVFSPDKCADKYDLGTWPKGEKRSQTFENVGCFSVVLCNVHPEMEAWILVLQNPYFAKTDDSGTYKIAGIPAGKYKLVAWHERLKSKSIEIEITADGSIKQDFVLTRR